MYPAPFALWHLCQASQQIEILSQVTANRRSKPLVGGRNGGVGRENQVAEIGPGVHQAMDRNIIGHINRRVISLPNAGGCHLLDVKQRHNTQKRDSFNTAG